MAWWPSLWTNLNTHQDVLGTVDRTDLLSYSLVLMPISFLFFPITLTDWNSLPSSARSTPSVNSFKPALHRLSGVTNSHHWAMPLQQQRVHSHSWIFTEELLGCFGSTFRPLIKNVSRLDKAGMLMFLYRNIVDLLVLWYLYCSTLFNKTYDNKQTKKRETTVLRIRETKMSLRFRAFLELCGKRNCH